MAIQYGVNLNSVGKAQVDSINALSNSASQKASQATTQAKAGLATLQNADPSASTAKMRGYGEQIAGTAGNMTQYANTVKDLAGELTTTADTLTDNGNAILGIGTDITNMNRDSDNEFVRTLLGNIDQYNPENNVSFAAQDAFSTFKTGEGQLDRSLSRSGVSASSGRNAALKQQYNIAMNTAIAAAKTRARASGLKEQTAALQTLASIGQSYTNQGKDFLTSGATVLGNAIGAQDTAASMEKTSADLFGSAASIVQSATNLELGYANSVVNQQNTVAASLRSEGALLDAQSTRELNFFNDQLKNTWTVTIGGDTTSESDPWAATGHTSTYWKNKLSTDDFTNMATQIGVSANLAKK